MGKKPFDLLPYIKRVAHEGLLVSLPTTDQVQRRLVVDLVTLRHDERAGQYSLPVRGPERASILSEARKYRLNITLANQYLEQLPLKMRHSLFGNIGTHATHATT